MKLRFFALAALGFLAASASAQQPGAPAAPKPQTPATAPKAQPATPKAQPATPAAQSGAPTSEKDKTSYAIGVQIAMGLKSQGVDIDPDMVAKGVKDVISGGKLLMSDQDLGTTLNALQEQIKAQQAAQMTKMAADNKKAGETFFAENAKKEGVVTLPSGLQYKILTAGTGKKPSATDVVSCNYRGTLIDGTEFDASQAGKPATFQVGGVIPGFKEVLQLMPVGSKWQVFIPSDLAYGPTGASNVIAPNQTLIFDLELVSIQDKPMPGQAVPQN
jgi:FKBP-type peptidyl-prolyl cis-trans isomerase FklB